MGAKTDEKTHGIAVKRHKRRGKVVAIWIVCILILGAAGFGVWRLFFHQTPREAMTGTTSYGALNEALQGSGTTEPADSATYTVSGTVLEWCVEAGDSVEAGDLLYVLDSSEAEDEMMENELKVEELTEQYQTLQESVAAQQITAAFSGRIENVQVEPGDDVQVGTMLAELVDDSTLHTTLYFSYQYQDQITTGMDVTLSVPDQMLTCTGSVTDVAYVDYVTAEGMRCFAVTVSVSNPGSLSEGMRATCWLTGSDGSELYAVDDGELSYAASETITAGASGEIVSVGAADYAHVSAGSLLFSIDGSNYETQLTSVEEQITYYQERIEELQEEIDTEYTRYSDITGQAVYAGYQTDRMTGTDTGSIMIYNQDSMEITVNVDELNADYLEVGMPVTVYRTTSSDTVEYPATLTYLSLEATSSDSGVSTFAATITIDSDGALSSGVTVYYSIDVSGSGTEETVLAPVGALCSYDDGYYLLVQTDDPPETAIDPASCGGSVTDYPEGYSAIPVEVGDSNETYVQILSGVEAEQTLFLRYRNAAPSGGETASEAGQSEQQMGTGERPDFGGGQMPDFGGGQMPSFGGGQMPGGRG